jgi:hypothetical protein
VEQKQAVWVRQLQCLQLVHQLAGAVGTGIRSSRLEGWGAHRGPRREESVWGEPVKMA